MKGIASDLLDPLVQTENDRPWDLPNEETLGFSLAVTAGKRWVGQMALNQAKLTFYLQPQSDKKIFKPLKENR